MDETSDNKTFKYKFYSKGMYSPFKFLSNASLNKSLKRELNTFIWLLLLLRCTDVICQLGGDQYIRKFYQVRIIQTLSIYSKSRHIQKPDRGPRPDQRSSQNSNSHETISSKCFSYLMDCVLINLLLLTTTTCLHIRLFVLHLSNDIDIHFHSLVMSFATQV